MLKGNKRKDLTWLIAGTIGSAAAGIIIGWLTGNIYAVVAVGILAASIMQRLKQRRERKANERRRGVSSKDRR